MVITRCVNSFGFYREFLEYDVSFPQDKIKEVSEVAVAHINAAVTELRRLFLVEDLVDSIKFGVLLWCLTYLGSWFNGMTLIIIGKRPQEFNILFILSITLTVP